MTERLQEVVRGHLPNIPLTMISQGAEALVFETNVHPYTTNTYLDNKNEFIIKYRPSKPYRHPKIDSAIIKTRTAGEVKFMHKLRTLGINAPAIILADYTNGLIWMDKLGNDLENGTVSSFKNWLWYLEHEKKIEECVGVDVKEVCEKVGEIIGKLHYNDMIHGDLTSSNIMLQNGEVFLIDFGLSSYSGMPEDKGVDLYVLERAVSSTHSVHSDKYTEWILDGYEGYHKSQGKLGTKKLVDIKKKLDEVKLRGRKRSMLG